MSNSDNIKQTADEALRSDERTLAAQIDLCAGSAQTAFKYALDWPNPSTLAAVDRVINLVKSFLADAQRLKDGGRPDGHARLTAILDDLTKARATLAQTRGNPVAADQSDQAKLVAQQKEGIAQQKEWLEKRRTQWQSQADENKKLL